MRSTVMETHSSRWQRSSASRIERTRRTGKFVRHFVCTGRKATSSQPNGRKGCCSREPSQNEGEPQPGLSLHVQIHYTQPVLPLPQASCTASPEPLRAMLVDGTAAIARIASVEAISFFVFDI